MHEDGCALDMSYLRQLAELEQEVERRIQVGKRMRDAGRGRREAGVGDGPRMSWHVDKDGVFTTVTIVGDRYGAVGNAKRHAGDRYEAQKGIDLAMARAFRDLADQLEAGAGL